MFSAGLFGVTVMVADWPGAAWVASMWMTPYPAPAGGVVDRLAEVIVTGATGVEPLSVTYAGSAICCNVCAPPTSWP